MAEFTALRLAQLGVTQKIPKQRTVQLPWLPIKKVVKVNRLPIFRAVLTDHVMSSSNLKITTPNAKIDTALKKP
jgi:hypothetical protein